ncbi:MAG: hypothetical protein R3C11_08570 [Planctomycetaceae bacterium]
MKSLSLRFILNSFLQLTLISAVLSVVALAHEDEDHKHEPVLVPAGHVWKPSAVPDRIVLSWKENPSNSQAVNWRTDLSVHRAPLPR